jgi:Lhr-like helicase
MSVTAKFLKAFDPKNKDHVMWLSKMTDVAEGMNDVENAVDYISHVNQNPMKLMLETREALDWPHIHFVLSASYAKAVLRGNAFIPSRTV